MPAPPPKKTEQMMPNCYSTSHQWVIPRDAPIYCSHCGAYFNIYQR